MTTASDRRALAKACRQLADERLEHCSNPIVIKRYSADPARLESRRQTALAVMEAASLLDRDASILEQRSKGVA